MLGDYIAMLAIGVLAACIVFILGRLMRRRGRQLPRWIMPFAIGASVITYSVWNEYTWFNRMQSALPDHVVVVGTGERSMPWAPWTYLAPVVSRFVAVDTAGISRSEMRPELVRIQIFLVERWQATRTAIVAFDCNKSLRADLSATARLSADGTLTGTQWQPAQNDTALLEVACEHRARPT
ncbi:MAG: hypothetical protein CL536_04870 [Alcaligenaceae bacterium]|jgi:hypothetical protein|uniref:Uncharacterized protein n=1 Tax=Neopusillimonas maritima TaxID=2026239 RepID=A0A3A1YWF4_9BURK|nr:hypothetical protein [Neopusillimonas maritima]MAL01464.1 hypothetical protein [Alcaligenaceae bacterium]MBF23543.1 hypothetical protein [Pusillimonas sp.]RIY41875.1 hypothetical protein CJP73_00025 [Neopusillimonas maritima]|tara:strand:+ start:816 stop:1358 length:543 start_codon:yes stop_codon:yes gene_type:complete